MKNRSLKVWAAVPVAALAALLMVGCSASTSAGTRDQAPAAGAGVPEYAPADGSDTTTRQIARTASIDVRVDDIAAATSQLRAIAAASDGLITAEDIRLPSDEQSSGYATVVVSVSADKLDATLAKLAELGVVQSQNINATDVTDQVVDVDSRVKTMRESIARLQDLIAQSGSVTEIAAVERELTERQTELEVLLAQQAQLGQRVAQAPITVTLWTKASNRPPESETGFLVGLAAGWETLTSLGVILLTALGAMLPFLGVAAVIGVPLFFWRRAWRKKHPKQPKMAPPQYYLPQTPPAPQPRPAAPAPAPQAAPAKPTAPQQPDSQVSPTAKE
ncbi:MAG: DUF4349 domain-containing protein [Propionibacteriaceae bacterium]|jgi:hypothetical protein|nr:DUF4349 domain-containing protein [Propionibacteriaceae bacterium]